ncbi:MAG TPA: hypothetical protein VLA49_15190 [Anaerolineales bacterium]|nr:hypothetical protein [Anaerolineales bacterium]
MFTSFLDRMVIESNIAAQAPSTQASTSALLALAIRSGFDFYLASAHYPLSHSRHLPERRRSAAETKSKGNLPLCQQAATLHSH